MQEKFNNLVEMQQKACKIFADRNLYGTKINGEYQWMTYGEVGEKINQMRGGLASLGISKGDKVAIIADNSAKWAISAYATYSLNAQYIPMYESQSDKDWSYILNDSGAKVLLVSTDEIYSRTKHFVNEIETLEHIVDLAGSESDPKSYASLLKVGQENPVDAVIPDSEDIMGMIYTSGTTGNPKGVLLSHGNIMSNVNAVDDLIDFHPDDCSLSFLPWAHIFGQTCEVHCLIYCGFSTGFAENVTTIIENLAEVRPTILFAVPRIFNKIYDGVNKKINDQGGLAKFLFTKGMDTANKKKAGDKLGMMDALWFYLADKIVFAKIRDRFGGRLRFAVSGASALSKEVADFIDNMGILVFEGYGLSETSPMVTVNSLKHRRIGSVGKPIPNVRVELDKSVVGEDSEDGEIIVYGPNVMKGYHNLPESTAEVMTADGGFRTGDLGKFDKDGFLYITGRIKEQYKLENGKYVVPSPLEEKLKLSPYINQVMLYGDNKLYNVALIVPDMEALQSYADEHGINEKGVTLLQDDRISELFRNQLETYSTSFKGYERPRKFILAEEEWSTDNGMLTPTMKLKRRVVMDKYKGMIEQLYD